jgi:Chaperone of endosialidase
MPADDLVINVRQIANYPASGVGPSDVVLVQRGGLGGPYYSVTPQSIVSDALSFGGSLGVGWTIPANAAGSSIFSSINSVPTDGAVCWNSYGALDGSYVYLQSGAAGRIAFDATGLRFATAVPGAAGSVADFTNEVVVTADGVVMTNGVTVGGVDVATTAFVAANSVNSFNGRNGAVSLWINDIINAGGAPQFSPRFTGCPRADTPGPCSNSTRLATTEFVQRAVILYIQNLLRDYPFVFTFNGRSGAVTLTEDDIVNAGGGEVFNDIALTGVPTAPTAAPGTSTDQLATTAFVAAAIAAAVAGLSDTYAPLVSPQFTGYPSGPTASPGTSTGQLATTAFVMNAVTEATTGVVSFNTRTGAVVLTPEDIAASGGALLTSPAFTGSPTAPTAAPGTSNTQLATTAFVAAALGAGGVSSFNGRNGAVTLTLADVTGAGGAPITSPVFTGSPAAPTPPPGDADTSIATTAFVAAALAGTVTTFNGRSGAVTLTAADVSAAGAAPLNSPALYGTPTAPTAAVGTNTTQIATTAFVENALAGGSGVTSFNGRGGTVTLTLADVTGAGGAPITSPALIGTPTAPTATAGDTSGQLATTAFVMNALGGTGPFLPLSGGTVSGALTVTGATTLASGSTAPSLFDAAGRVRLGVAGATPATALAGSVFISANITSTLGWNITGNLYFDGTNWRYMTAGAGALAALPQGGPFQVVFYSAGAAGAVASGTTVFSVTSAGNLTTTGGIVGSTLGAASGSLNVAGPTNTVISMFNGSNFYSDPTYFGIGLSGPFQSTSSWRDLYARATGARSWLDFAGNVLMALVSGGNLSILGTLSQASDERLKSNIIEAPDGLAEIRRMRPRRYRRIVAEPPADQPGWRSADTDRDQLGFVAQEMQDALPHAVREHGGGTLAIELMPLIAALTNAVKELDARLATMEARAA